MSAILKTLCIRHLRLNFAGKGETIGRITLGVDNECGRTSAFRTGQRGSRRNRLCGLGLERLEAEPGIGIDCGLEIKCVGNRNHQKKKQKGKTYLHTSSLATWRYSN